MSDTKERLSIDTKGRNTRLRVPELDRRELLDRGLRSILGERTAPVGYDIKVKTGFPVYLDDSEHNPDTPTKDIKRTGTQLVVQAMPSFINDQARYELMRMAVGVPQNPDNELTLINGAFSVRTNLGRDKYLIKYKAVKGGIARMETVWPLIKKGVVRNSSDTLLHPVLSKGVPLTNRQINNLPFADSGFPNWVDWVNTFRMYDLQIAPDERGDFEPDPRALTAQDINRMPLIPARRI